MTMVEVLIAIGFIVIIIVVVKLSANLGAMSAKIENISKNQDEFLRQTNEGKQDIIKITQDIKNKVEFANKSDEELVKNLSETQKVIDSIRLIYEERRKFEDETREYIGRLTSIMSGTQKGRAAEHLIEEKLMNFPGNVIIKNCKIRGGEVEFAFKLPDSRILPIDLKLVATDLISEYESANDEEEKKEIADEIDRKVRNKLDEVVQYISIPETIPFAVAVVPDIAYFILRKSIAEAYQKRIVIVSTNMLVPYLLTFLFLYQQNASNINTEYLVEKLKDMDVSMNRMQDIMENKIKRGNTMIANAYNEFEEVIGSLKGTLSFLQTTKQNPEDSKSQLT